jgi:hypothetical protein
MASSFVKDPAAVLDYQWDWSSWLATGETISSHTVTAPTGLTLDSDTATTTAVTAWLSGGTAGTDYSVVCQIVTSASRTDERSIVIAVQQR